jgi:hypothetical protein
MSRLNRNGELPRVVNAAGEPAAISTRIAPLYLYGAEACADGGAKRMLVPIEDDG